MKRAYVSGTMTDDMAKKHGGPKSFKNVGKQTFSAWPKNTAAQTEHGWPEIIKNVGKQANCGGQKNTAAQPEHGDPEIITNHW